MVILLVNLYSDQHTLCAETHMHGHKKCELYWRWRFCNVVTPANAIHCLDVVATLQRRLYDVQRRLSDVLATLSYTTLQQRRLEFAVTSDAAATSKRRCSNVEQKTHHLPGNLVRRFLYSNDFEFAGENQPCFFHTRTDTEGLGRPVLSRSQIRVVVLLTHITQTYFNCFICDQQTIWAGCAYLCR